jgi:hypothetical protein
MSLPGQVYDTDVQMAFASLRISNSDKLLSQKCRLLILPEIR